MAPPRKAIIQPKPRRSARGTAPRAMIMAVPGPRISAGISHRRPSWSTCRLMGVQKEHEGEGKGCDYFQRGAAGHPCR